MSVFIAHKKEDEEIAKKISSILHKNGVETYLDVLDPALFNKTDITTKILNGLNKCSHLLAVISAKTSESWWVPFEIGVATKGEKRICTYSTVTMITLPDYLTMWPIITQLTQLDFFC